MSHTQCFKSGTTIYISSSLRFVLSSLCFHLCISSTSEELLPAAPVKNLAQRQLKDLQFGLHDVHLMDMQNFDHETRIATFPYGELPSPSEYGSIPKAVLSWVVDLGSKVCFYRISHVLTFAQMMIQPQDPLYNPPILCILFQLCFSLSWRHDS